ncbi:MAG TPA: hypothetical protein VEC11_08490 [Allosphingosinicella sp.]|nr:hypothetical protein [Allosphingosinicella sp.]
MRVRVFIDHWEFARSWQLEHSKITRRKLTEPDRRNAQIESQMIQWALLPDAILKHLSEMAYIGDAPKEMRAIDVYASILKTNDAATNAFRDWLDEELDPLPGFQVHNFLRKQDTSTPHCSRCGADLEKPELEKGLKTKVACDMLSCAVKDLYDIGVLIMDDAELVPSVLSVQEIFDKQIIHVGARNEGDELRSAAWGHFLLEDLMPDIISSDEFRRQFDNRRKNK